MLGGGLGADVGVVDLPADTLRKALGAAKRLPVARLSPRRFGRAVLFKQPPGRPRISAVTFISVPG